MCKLFDSNGEFREKTLIEYWPVITQDTKHAIKEMIIETQYSVFMIFYSIDMWS